MKKKEKKQQQLKIIQTYIRLFLITVVIVTWVFAHIYIRMIYVSFPMYHGINEILQNLLFLIHFAHTFFFFVLNRIEHGKSLFTFS